MNDTYFQSQSALMADWSVCTSTYIVVVTVRAWPGWAWARQNLTEKRKNRDTKVVLML